MSSEEDEPVSKAPSPEKSEEFEQLKTKFLEIFEEHFFGNLKHEWRGRDGHGRDQDQDDPNRYLCGPPPSYESLSDESGSYLMLDGKKISFDWFRTALANFIAEQEKNPPVPAVQAEPESYENPYAVPSPKEMAALRSRKDRFNTQKSRSGQGIQSRLLVEDVDFEQETIGARRKYPSKLATQLDAHYRNEITYQPRISNYKRVSAIHKLREDCRRKFETYYRKEYLVGATEVDRAEKMYHKDFHECYDQMVEALKNIRFERFTSSMRAIDKVKPCYEETARCEAVLRDREQQMDVLWNTIVHLENVWTRRVQYQNFLYLISPKAWRVENDWIHKDENGELESFEKSIAERTTANLRNLDDSSDIMAVKEFFEDEYLAKDKPVHTAFEDSAALVRGIEALSINLMTSLNRLNVVIWAEMDAERETVEIEHSFEQMIKNLRRTIEDITEKARRCEERSSQLKTMFDQLVQEPLRASVADPRAKKLDSLVYVLYKQLLPPEQREHALRFSAIENFIYIFNLAIKLFEDIDKIPPDLLKSVEKEVRFKRKMSLRIAKRAYDEGQRQKMMAIQLKRDLAPPYVKPPRKGKLPRSRLVKKPIPEVIIPPVVTKLDKIFATAFGPDATMSATERRNLREDLYFPQLKAIRHEQFLHSIGHEPSRDFVTRMQRRYGPETNLLRRKELIPKVMAEMKQWEQWQEEIKQQLLQRGSELLRE